jgi:hypothetical protein
MKKKMKKGRIGPSFDDFLKEKGIYEEATARAKLRRQKKVAAAFGKYPWRGNLAASRRDRGARGDHRRQQRQALPVFAAIPG